MLASFLVLIVLDGSKLPKTALSEKFNLLLKESSQLDSNLREFYVVHCMAFLVLT